ncbi:MAG: GTPase RsgA [Candidatus Altiarchaeota archaeon]|nr:GTPase RsgA [Candidatus Altiarchaeota archaeon]
MKKKRDPWDRVMDVIRDTDLIIEIVDARFPHRSGRLARVTRKRKRPVLFVLNKSDLMDPEEAKLLAKKMDGFSFCAITGKGKARLIEAIRSFKKGKDFRIGVVGRPNVGKSSLINVLRGRKTARTSPEAGFTKGEQWFRISPGILVIDTPGVILEKTSWTQLAIQNAVRVEKLDDPVIVAVSLLKRRPEIAKQLELPSDPIEALEVFAKKSGKLLKGGTANIDEAARMLIRNWQRGLFK